ncbi:hypothetical protein [Altererythrobacter sp.]|uniref:hypothetical protein n=1 Tax=Altererythrobacter sp. TaxID=1872480 RepID=UPI003D1322EF
MRLAAVSPIAFGVLLAGCGETVTERSSINFSGGTIELVRTSIGGATGDERIELSFENGGETSDFFEGSNFSEFNVSERDGRILIQMCRGRIAKAEPFLIGDIEGDFQVKRLDLDWNCKDKRHEA